MDNFPATGRERCPLCHSKKQHYCTYCGDSFPFDEDGVAACKAHCKRRGHFGGHFGLSYEALNKPFIQVRSVRAQERQDPSSSRRLDPSVQFQVSEGDDEEFALDVVDQTSEGSDDDVVLVDNDDYDTEPLQPPAGDAASGLHSRKSALDVLADEVGAMTTPTRLQLRAISRSRSARGRPMKRLRTDSVDVDEAEGVKVDGTEDQQERVPLSWRSDPELACISIWFEGDGKARFCCDCQPDHSRALPCTPDGTLIRSKNFKTSKRNLPFSIRTAKHSRNDERDSSLVNNGAAVTENVRTTCVLLFC